jgi:hypothetical protein
MRNDALLTGDAAWLPFIYTLQGLYLVYNPVQLGLLPSAAILVPLLLVFFFFLESAECQLRLFCAASRRRRLLQLPFCK